MSHAAHGRCAVEDQKRCNEGQDEECDHVALLLFHIILGYEK